MRFPIKVKTEVIPSFLRRIIPNKPDPTRLITSKVDETQFSRCASSICIGGIWRTTSPGRHPESNKLLARTLAGTPARIVDVGVSDGGTSVDLYLALGADVRSLVVTDVCLKVRAVRQNGGWYLFRPDAGACLMAVFDHLIYYNVITSNSFLGGHAAAVFAAAPSPETGSDVFLMNPRLMSTVARDSRVELREWDVFTPWRGERMDVVRVANLLNPAYFTTAQLREAMSNCYRAVEGQGWMMVVDNRKSEKATLFRKEGGRLTVAARVGDGADAEALLCNGWGPTD